MWAGEVLSQADLMSLLGGALIGAASSLVLVLKGRVAGVSGIFGSLISGPREAWRIAFVAGLVLGGVALALLYPSAFAAPSDRALWAVALAGLFVGMGTAHGNGCTSGHGVCGIGRLSKRSMVATATFMTTGFATASLVHLLGGLA